MSKINNLLNKINKLKGYNKGSLTSGLVGSLVYLKERDSFLGSAPITVRINGITNKSDNKLVSMTPLHARAQTSMYIPLNTYGTEWILKPLKIKQ